MFIHDHKILFDTPEDIAFELENAGIGQVEHLFYTHWHPDHLFGARVIEQMNTTWSDEGEWRMIAKAKTTVHMPGIVNEEIMQRLGPFFEFWKHVGVAVLDDSEASLRTLRHNSLSRR
jgi:phosphoribosyl 1,2-cyclic phosphate phosphodiesterase